MTETLQAGLTAVSTVGFPIVATFILGYLLKNEQETHKEETNSLKEAINSMSVYIEYLEKSDGTLSDPTLRADVEATINIMKSEYTSLTGVFNIHR